MSSSRNCPPERDTAPPAVGIAALSTASSHFIQPPDPVGSNGGMVLEELTGTAPTLDPHRCAGAVAIAGVGGGISTAGRDSSVEHARISTDGRARMLYLGQPLEGFRIPGFVRCSVLMSE